MNRAAKTKKYRRKARRKQAREQGRFRFLSLLSGSLVLLVLIILFFSKKNDPSEELMYVTNQEWKSMLSVFGADLEHNRSDKNSEYVTGETVKDTLWELGLSSEITVIEDKKKLKRKKVTEYYEQILDYLDMGQNVNCKTILYLKDSKDQIIASQGTYQRQFELPELLSLQAYQVYLQDDILLGIKSSSKEIMKLKDVLIKKLDKNKKQIIFTYKNNTYKIKCKQIGQFEEGMECTLSIKEGEIQKAENIKLQMKNTVNTDEIKVILLNQNKIYRDSIYIFCDCKFYTTLDEKKKMYKKDEEFSVIKSKLQIDDHIVLKSDENEALFYLSDGSGNPISNGYYGSMIIYRDKNGYYIVNKVKVEKYLYSVVASEMPASFDMEALKAQAVCARSYVYRQMESDEYKDYHAQIDDSTNYQVYNLSQAVEADRQAVNATAGELMYYGDEIVNAYYFSTSCGYSSGMEIWNHEGEEPYLKPKALIKGANSKFDFSDEKKFSAYILKSEEKAYDSHSPYFRWKAQLKPNKDLSSLKAVIEQRKAINPGFIQYFDQDGKQAMTMEGFGSVTDLQCEKRNKSGAVLELLMKYEYGYIKITSEYNIRYILGSCMEQIEYADGKQGNPSGLLPSAYGVFSYDQAKGCYVMHGGGNGHGMGMSQYAADAMGRSGWDYKKILQYSYDGVEIRKNQ